MDRCNQDSNTEPADTKGTFKLERGFVAQMLNTAVTLYPCALHWLN